MTNAEAEVGDGAAATQPVDELIPLHRSDQSQLEGRPADDVFARIPGEREERCVDVEKAPIRQAGDADRGGVRVERLGEPLLGFAQRLFGPVACDGDPREVGGGRDEILLGTCRDTRLAVVHRERPQDPAGGGKNRRRPAGAQAVGVGEGAVVLPQWIDLHVAHDDGLAGEGGRPARSRARPDLQPVHRGVVPGRQVRCGAVPQPFPVTVAQEDRA